MSWNLKRGRVIINLNLCWRKYCWRLITSQIKSLTGVLSLAKISSKWTEMTTTHLYLHVVWVLMKTKSIKVRNPWEPTWGSKPWTTPHTKGQHFLSLRRLCTPAKVIHIIVSHQIFYKSESISICLTTLLTLRQETWYFISSTNAFFQQLMRVNFLKSTTCQRRKKTSW